MLLLFLLTYNNCIVLKRFSQSFTVCTGRRERVLCAKKLISTAAVYVKCSACKRRFRSMYLRGAHRCVYMDCVYIAFFHLVSWEYYSDRIVCCCGSANLCTGRLVYNLKCVALWYSVVHS